MSKFARNSGDYRIDRNYRTYRTRDLSIESIEGRPDLLDSDTDAAASAVCTLSRTIVLKKKPY